MGNRTNLTRAGSAMSQSFDAANRLVSLDTAPYSAGYADDGDGVRVARSTIGAPETNRFTYVYDRSGALPTLVQEGAETAANTTTTAVRKYVWGAAGLAYVVAGSGAGTPSVMHADGLGTVRALTDATGSVTQVYRTDAFGVLAALPESSNPPGPPYRFAGEQWDYEKATAGLVFLRARSYDPDLGRFLQRDPLAGSTGSPQSLNRYAYALNNPTTRTDPSGLAPLKSVVLDGGFCIPTPLGCITIREPEQGQLQSPIPCPASSGFVQAGTPAGADFRRVSGPEKSGGGYACHVNVVAGTVVNEHIEYDASTDQFISRGARGVGGLSGLGSSPFVAAHTVAQFAANFLARTGPRSTMGTRFIEYYVWYMGRGALFVRLNNLRMYAP